MAYSQSKRLTPKQKAVLKSIKKPVLAPPSFEAKTGYDAFCSCKHPVIAKAVIGINPATRYWCIRCGGDLPLKVLDRYYDQAFDHDQLEQVYGTKTPRVFVNRARGLPDDYDGETVTMSNNKRSNGKMLQRAEAKEGEGGYDFLTVKDAARYGKGKVIQAPRLVDTKFGEKLFVDLELKKGLVRTWSANNKSRNYLIDKLGNNEKKWIGKTIEIVVVEQMVEGDLKDVIYAKGAVKKK